MTDFTSLWDDAGAAAETEAAERRLATAKVASADLWPFLARSADLDEFGARLNLVEEDLTKAASVGGVSVGDLVTTYTRQFGLLAEARKATAASQCTCGHASLHHADGGACPDCGCKQFRAARTAGVVDKAKELLFGHQAPAPSGKSGHPFDAEGTADWLNEGLEDRQDKNKNEYEASRRSLASIKQATDQPLRGEGDDECDFCGEKSDALKRTQNHGTLCPKCVPRLGDDAPIWDLARSVRTSQRSLASIKQALEEGQDPLEWLEGEGGVGQPEKVGGHSEGDEQTTPNANQPLASRRPF